MEDQTRKFWLTELFVFITVDQAFKFSLWDDIPPSSVCRCRLEVTLHVGAASGGA
jgi:hypothetical protein